VHARTYVRGRIMFADLRVLCMRHAQNRASARKSIYTLLARRLPSSAQSHGAKRSGSAPGLTGLGTRHGGIPTHRGESLRGMAGGRERFPVNARRNGTRLWRSGNAFCTCSLTQSRTVDTQCATNTLARPTGGQHPRQRGVCVGLLDRKKEAGFRTARTHGARIHTDPKIPGSAL
jgi:hypothetical protein